MISWAVVAVSAAATFWAWRDPYFFFGALDLLWLVVDRPAPQSAVWDPRYLFVSSLLHHDFAHLFSNALYLLIFGVALERGMPARNYLFLLVVLLLGAKAASNLLTVGPSIGMSGVVYGLMGFYLLPYFRRKAPIFCFFMFFGCRRGFSPRCAWATIFAWRFLQIRLSPIIGRIWAAFSWAIFSRGF